MSERAKCYKLVWSVYLKPGNIIAMFFPHTTRCINTYIELIDFKARWLDPDLQRFISPDDIVPDLNNPQSLNRYSYVNNDPINSTDPTGHKIACDDGYLGSCGDSGYSDDPSQPASTTPSDASDRSKNNNNSSNSTNLVQACFQDPVACYQQASANASTATSIAGNSNVPMPQRIGAALYASTWDVMNTVAIGGGAIVVVGYGVEIGTAIGIRCAADEQGCADEAGQVVDKGSQVVDEGIQNTTSSIDDLVQQAQEQYPNKAGNIELHHIFPQYLGGDPNGPVVPLDAAYHQVITNAFRALWPYGQGAPALEQAQQIMQQVYNKFPLP